MFSPNSHQKCRSSRLQMFFRSSRPEMFCKKAVLRDFPKFTRKHLFQSLFFTKVAGQGQQLYLKWDPVSWCFLWILWNLEEHFTEHIWWLLLVLQNRCSYKFPDIHQKSLPDIHQCWSHFLIQLETGRPATLIKKRPQHKCFSSEYHTIFKNSCFIEHPRWLLLNMVEEFRRISNSS